MNALILEKWPLKTTGPFTQNKIKMKKIIIITILALTVFTANAQWSTPVQIGSTLFCSIAGDNNSTVHVAYGDGNISYKRSNDEGASWSSPIILGSGTIYYDKPIYVDGSNVYVVYFSACRKGRCFQRAAPSPETLAVML